ncbi:FimD/PapC N-terminal domain-containing protein, partial [Escherichia coli]
MSWMVVSRTYTSLPFSLSVLALTVAGSFSATAGKFNPRFLEDTAGINQHVDLSMYETDHGAQLPGTYRVSLIVNEQKMETRTLEFKAATESQRKEMGEFLIPCLSRTQLADMG